MPRSGSLAGLLETRRPEVLTRWKERVVGTLTPEGTRTPEILDGLPGFLEQVASDLADGCQRPAAPNPDATEHGSQRFHAGFSVGAVIREYQVLQECILIQKGADRSGYGLGLAIAKRAAEAHLGTIQARNLPSEGCIFSVDIPLRQPLRPDLSFP